jgi:hypothetical protein
MPLIELPEVTSLYFPELPRVYLRNEFVMDDDDMVQVAVGTRWG